MRARLAVVCAVALLAAGCSDTRTVDLRVRGVAPLNLNEQQESTPVRVRVYPLVRADAFRAATPNQLWTDGEKVLGADLRKPWQEFTVNPGAATDQPVTVPVTISDAAEYLGILAMCSRSDADDRRTTVLSLREDRSKILTFTGYAVALRSEGEAPVPGPHDGKGGAR